MSNKQPRNERWKQILEAADAGIIDPRDAIIGAQEHYEGAYGSNFAAAVRMLEQQAQALETLAQNVEAVRVQVTTEDGTPIYAVLEDKIGLLNQTLTADRGNRGLILQHLERSAAWQDRQEAAVGELRADFRALFEIVNGHTLDINDLKQTVAEHDRAIASFRQSRDASIEERRRLSADLDASKEDRARIHE
jgi:hypothetical protein